MSDDSLSLSKKEREQIVEWHTEGYNPREMSLKFAKSDDYAGTTRSETIKEYLKRDEVKEEIELRKNIKEKEAEYTQEELIRDLKNLKEEMWSYFRTSKDEGHGITANEAAKNMLKATKQLGDYLDAFENKSMDANVVKINELNINNMTHIVKKMPAEQKKDIVQQLKDDPEIEDFVIKRRKNVVGQESKKQQKPEN